MSKCLQCDKHRETRGGVCEDCREANASRAFSALSSRPRADPKDATIRDLEAALAEAREANGKMAEALERIERWHGEFPPTGRFWDEPHNTRPMSYAAAWGSNGERDFMRVLAKKALAHRIATKEQDRD